MKKVSLLKNEKIIHRIRFSKRIFFIDILLLIAILTTSARLGITSPISFLLLIAFFPLTIKALFDFYRINFHRPYLSNFRIIYVKGFYLKRIKTYDLDKVTDLFFKNNILDFQKNMMTFKVEVEDEKPFMLRNIKEGDKVGEFLSEQIQINKSKQK